MMNADHPLRGWRWLPLALAAAFIAAGVWAGLARASACPFESASVCRLWNYNEQMVQDHYQMEQREPEWRRRWEEEDRRARSLRHDMPTDCSMWADFPAPYAACMGLPR